MTGAFRAFEHAGWQSVVTEYDRAFARLTAQSIEPLLDAVGVVKGMRLLDVATGPGYVAAAAAQRGASVVGVDFSAAMVAEARRRQPAVDFREGDAEALPFPEGSFEAVVMNFGLLHLENPERAIGEAHRVLHPRARFGFTVWAPPETAVGFAIVLRAIRTHGDPNVPLPAGPPFFRFSDPGECRRALGAAGFAAPTILEVPQVWRFDAPDELFEVFYGGTVRTAGLLRGQTPAAQAAIRDAVSDAANTYRRGSGLELPMPAILVSATKG